MAPPPAALRDGFSAQSGLEMREAALAVMDGVGAGGVAQRLSVRSAIVKRQLGTGPIVGITIGTVVGVALIVVCLYPFAVYYYKKWKRRNVEKLDPAFPDVEPGEAGPNGAAAPGAPMSETDLQRRISMRPTFSSTLHHFPLWSRQSTKELSLGYDGWTPNGDGAVPKPLRVSSIGSERGQPFATQVHHPPTWLSSRRSTGLTLAPESSAAATSSAVPPPPEPQLPASPESPLDQAAVMELIMTPSNGFADSYYNTAVPTEAFTMVTPPGAEAVPALPRQSTTRRESSKSSSLRQMLAIFIGKQESKDSQSHPRIPVIPSPAQHAMAGADPTLAGSPVNSLPYPIRPTGIPSPPGQMVVAEVVSESPTELSHPMSFKTEKQDSPTEAASPLPAPGLGSPIHLASYPPAALSPAATELEFSSQEEGARAREDSSRLTPPASALQLPELKKSETPTPIPSPKQPPPGTVNPMEIMKPSNQTELNWHTTAQLHYMASSPPPNPPTQLVDQSTAVEPPPVNGFAGGHDYSESADSPMQEAPEPIIHHIVTRPTMDSTMTGTTTFVPQLPTPVENGGGLLPPGHAHRRSQDSDRSDLSGISGISGISDVSGVSYPIGGAADFSPPYAGPSAAVDHQTPGTPFSGNTGSPGSEGSSHIQNGVSPYAAHASPRTLFPCDLCPRAFDQIHKLNHHKRYHERPHECTEPGCGKRFGTKTHLHRHINDKHMNTKKFHCTVSGCAYSRLGGKSFPRKDNWRRHMINIHNHTPENEPEPDVVDATMGGI